MGWDIKVSHEDVDDKARLIIEAEAEVPDEVISAVAGAYWLQEVQYLGDAWDGDELEGPGPLHG
jgi:hypothetical protein